VTATRALTGDDLSLAEVWAVAVEGSDAAPLSDSARARMAAARQGVGDRVKRYSEILIALDERYEDAAGHRILGRLHTLAPKVPFVTGWVDRGKAVSELRRAVALGPDNFDNHVFLAEALFEHQPEKAAEARDILRRLLARAPSPELAVEQAESLAKARALLAKHPG